MSSTKDTSRDGASAEASSQRGQAGAGLPRQAAGRVAALVGSVMDLHVRIALQEADREKRRLISGLLLLAGGLGLVTLALVAAEGALLLWIQSSWGLGWIQASLAVGAIDLVLAGLFLRIGGQLTKGPYLPQTIAGLTKTTRALLGR
jgi:uncharacterized membrane protein YqjE